MNNTYIHSNNSAKMQVFSYAFILSGLIAIIITSWSLDEGSLIGNISGYAIVLFGTIILTIINSSDIITSAINSKQWMELLRLVLPSIFLIGSITFSLIITIMYFGDIIKQSVPYYGTFSTISVLLILSQLYLLFVKMGNKIINLRLSSLIGFINIVIVTTIYIILKNYPTDC